MRRFLLHLIPIILFGQSHSQEGEPKKMSLDQSLAGKMSTRMYQDQSQNGQTEISKSSLYLQFNTSSLYPRLTDWKNQNPLPNGTSPSSNSIVFGGEVGCVLYRYVQVGIGYEFFFTTKVTTRYASGDQIETTFFYGSVKAGIPLESVPNLDLFAAFDMGSLKTTEILENYYYGLDMNKTGSATGYRVIAGARYIITDQWSIMAGGGYLFGNVKTITANGQVWPHYSLDLSGFTLRFAVNYHIPL
jgi:opacity protein-like surface antigen